MAYFKKKIKKKEKYGFTKGGAVKMAKVLKIRIFGKYRYFKTSAAAKKAFLYSGDPNFKSFGWVERKK
jgi:hypothetical protein